ncbi:MAG: adenylyltransferase/cytidyltransferase family protein [Opitutaceae bacterium]|nr:adenylyltransferase/cytidyltransferase family protein [Opitutaceae bacterium]
MSGARKFAVVYTTGAFDPFHFGHLNILRRAREIADTLIVGVSTDELIRQAKGREPFMPLEQRMAIIAELRCVDRVVAQIDKNKQRVVDELKVDAIVVGSDWRGRYPPVSCELIYFDYTDGISSSLLRGARGESHDR